MQFNPMVQYKVLNMFPWDIVRQGLKISSQSSLLKQS